jgi:hypothetical protein
MPPISAHQDRREYRADARQCPDGVVAVVMF